MSSRISSRAGSAFPFLFARFFLSPFSFLFLFEFPLNFYPLSLVFPKESKRRKPWRRWQRCLRSQLGRRRRRRCIVSRGYNRWRERGAISQSFQGCGELGFTPPVRQQRGDCRFASVEGTRSGGNMGNSRLCRSPDYQLDHELSYIDSFSSSDKENVNPGRKRMLDDALFEFFRKEAVKSLKMDFSNFCNDSDIWNKNKMKKDHGAVRDDFVSYSIKYFWDVLNSLSIRRREVIRNFGFGSLLLFEKSDIPSVFVRWLASCIDPVSSHVIVDGCKILPISKDYIHYVIGLPNSGSVSMADSEGGAKFIMSMFGLADLPHITFFGNKLKSKEVLTGKEIFVCFMIVAFKCFLFPTMDEFSNTDFLGILQDPTPASGVDLCLLVYEHLISGVSKFSRTCKLNARKPKHFEFYYYVISVYYLDSLDFGARKLDQSVPRISVWKGNLIKLFSDLDHKKKNLFGKRQLKKNLPHCYREFGAIGDSKSDNDASNHFLAEFKNSLHIKFGSRLEPKIIDGIIDSVWSAQHEKLPAVLKCELLVNNVLNFLIGLKSCEVKMQPEDSNVRAQDTISSDHVHTEIDIASNLDLISPNVFSKAIPTYISTSEFVRSPGSLELLSSKAGGINIVKTAPVMQPMHKVKSRLSHSVLEEQALPSLNTYPCGVKDSRSLVFMASPISRINFSPFSNAKVTDALSDSKGCLLEDNQIGRNMNFTGSKQAPIPISDFSPKPQINQSPGLEITGTSSFRFRQGELAKKGDEMYNIMSNNVAQQGLKQCVPKLDAVKTIENFIDLSQNTFEERLPKDDLVILQPKNSLVLPLVQNGRFAVSDLDIKHYCAIVDLAYTKGIQKTYAVKFSKVHCSYISLGQSLMVAGHVDNFLLPVFCRKLFEDNHPSKYGRHHFFSLVGESILDYENDVQYSFVSKAFLGAASASKGKRLELSDRLFFPICRSRHWFAFSVDFKYKIFVFLDSLYNKEDDFHISIKRRLINNFIKLWMLIFKTDENIFKNFGVMYANVPKQDNADDCGIFTMKLMEIFKPELNMRRYFSKEDIVNIKIQYANKLFFCKRNNADKSVVVDYHPQG